MRDLGVLAVLVVVLVGVNQLRARLAETEGPWYAAVRKPVWLPPQWASGPVWTLLYLTLAVATWTVWRRVGTAAMIRPLLLIGFLLLIHLVWTAIFFRLHDPGSAMVVAALLVLGAAGTAAAFLRVDTAAGLLVAPYLLWTAVSVVVTYQVWRLNAL